jgi:hypothetical protein
LQLYFDLFFSVAFGNISGKHLPILLSAHVTYAAGPPHKTQNVLFSKVFVVGNRRSHTEPNRKSREDNPPE